MSQHVHYDLEDFERRLRADAEKARAFHARKVATGGANEQFFRAQTAFDEAAIQFALAGARLANEGIDENLIVSAGAVSCGISLASMMGVEPEPERVAHTLSWFARSFNDCVNTIRDGEPVDGASPVVMTKLEPVPGGRA